jgi:TetR/AcrR family hemagglutinin/protease transcriptional regulator
MGPEKTRRRLPQNDRRSQLLACALKVAARKGLGRMAHTEIARECGVAVPTAFLYFPNRRELLLAVIGEVDRFYIALGRGCHHAAQSPNEAIRRHLYAFVESIDSHPEYAQVWLEWATLVRNEEGLWDAFLDFQERIIRMLSGSIRRGQTQGTVSLSVSAPDAGRLITASAYAIAQLKFMKRKDRMVQRYVDHTVALALGETVLPAG